MKRIAALVLGASMALSSVGAASAIDVKVAGEWDFAFGWAKNTSFYANDNKNGSNEDSFISRSRVRTQINFIASEQLQGVLMFEIGDLNWGRGSDADGSKNGQGSGGDLDADGVNVETKRAYLDWMIPDTDVSIRMGIQGMMFPSGTGLGNPVLNNDVAGITVNIPINEMFGLTAVWARPFDAQENDGDRNLADETDIFALMLPISGEGFTVTPWAAYGNIGMGSGYFDYVIGDYFAGAGGEIYGNGDATQAWWAGIAVEVSVFDPLTFGFDAMYGHMNQGLLSVVDNALAPTVRDDAMLGMGGWFVDANLNYQLDWGTPGIFGWWTSGDDADDIEEGDVTLGRMPAIGFDSGFAPTGFGAPGSAGIGSDTMISATMIGTWGFGAQIADMSFVDKLSHTFRVAYYRGTNDPNVPNMVDSMPFLISGESVYMTTDDWAFEVNFDHKYQIYENLAAIVELSYIHLDLDESTWSFNDLHDTDDAWKAQLLFQYNF